MNRYWVGGTGNWSDNTNHWSTISGGAAGASLPTSADNVYFDANSFNATGQIVTVNTSANCLDMDWTGSLCNPTLAGGSSFNIYGSLKFILSMIITHIGNKSFLSTTTGKTITTANKSHVGNFNFSGIGGSWIIQDALTTDGTVRLINGSLNTNDKSISCGAFTIDGGTNSVLAFGASSITCFGGWTATNGGISFNPGTSNIKMTNGAPYIFAGGGLTYNNVEFQGTPTTITGSNTFAQLKVAAGKVVKLTAGTTQTVTTLSVDGASIQSATAGSAATITTPNDDIVVRTATIQDITATKPIYALRNSVNVSGNTGITFTDKVFRGNIGAVKCTTTDRPTTNLLIGMQYYDTTLNKPIWYKGSSVWVDATGTTV